jgi:hypothetical protein
LGRFTSEDPLQFVGSGSDFYRYADGNPVRWYDPFGLAKCVYSVTLHTLVCQPNRDGIPAVVGPNKPDAIRLGPEGVFSGEGDCKNNATNACLNAVNNGPIIPSLYSMNYDDRWKSLSEWPSHDRFRLEPLPNDFWSRQSRRGSRLFSLGAQLHRGSRSLGCINVEKDNPGLMKLYDELFLLLMREEGANTLTVLK